MGDSAPVSSEQIYKQTYGEPFVPKLSIASDKTQSLVLKYQSLVIKLNR